MMVRSSTSSPSGQHLEPFPECGGDVVAVYPVVKLCTIEPLGLEQKAVGLNCTLLFNDTELPPRFQMTNPYATPIIAHHPSFFSELPTELLHFIFGIPRHVCRFGNNKQKSRSIACRLPDLNRVRAHLFR